MLSQWEKKTVERIEEEQAIAKKYEIKYKKKKLKRNDKIKQKAAYENKR